MLPKNKVEHISRSTVRNDKKFDFTISPIRGLPKHFKAKVLTTCLYLIQSLFKKQKRGLELDFLPHTSARFLKKNIAHAMF